MTPAKIPVLRSVFAAYAFFVANWRPILLAGLPYTVAVTVQMWLVQTYAGTEAPAGIGFASLVLLIVTFVASIALSAAAMRFAVRGDYGGWLGLRLGADEGRFFAITFLIALLVFFIFVLVFMFWLAVVGAVAGGALEGAGVDPEAEGLMIEDAFSYLGQADWAAVLAVSAGGLAVIAWLAARLVLAVPATVKDQRVRVLNAWPLSKGNAWRIAAAAILAWLPVLIIEIGLYELLAGLTGSRFLAVNPASLPEGLEPGAYLVVTEYQRWIGLLSAINIGVFSGLYAYMFQVVTKPRP